MAILRVPERRAGTIPQYNRQMVYNTTPGADASARLSDAAGAIAAQGARESWQPVIATGKAVQQAAKVGLDLYTEYNKTKAFEAYNKFQESMTADLYGENGVFNRRGENAQNSVADTEELVRTRAEEFAANLSDMGKNFFRQQVGQYNRQLLPQVQRHETHEFNAWQVGTQKTRAELALNDALENYNNSDVFDQRLQESNLALMEIGRINGLSREQTELAVRQNTSAAQLSRANAFLSQDNIAGAKAVLATGLMEGKDKITLENAIRTKQDALEAKARAEAEKAERETEKRLVSGTVSEILSGVSDYPSLEEQQEAAFAQVDRIADPTVRDKVRTEIRQEMSWKKDMEDATVSREVRQYQELARREGWTPRQASENVNNAAISDRAKEKLSKDYDGRAEKATPKNKAALDELRRQIDLGAEKGGIDRNDTDKIDAFIEQHALTYEQSKAAHQYAEQGGAAGKLTQTHLNQAYKSLFPKRKPATMPVDLYDLVASELEPGKPVTHAQVRQIMSRLYTEGKTDGSGWFSDRETYADALRNERGEQWVPDIDVPESERRRIEDILRDNGITVTEDRIRRYYWDELEGEI